jgi:hypothetical protein
MANAKTLVVGGQSLNVIDDTARSNAQTALNNAEYNRQGQIGKYGGQNIATILAAACTTRCTSERRPATSRAFASGTTSTCLS